MAGAYILAVDGLKDVVKSVEDMDPAIMRAVRMALNKTADRAKASASRHIRQEINFRASYLSGSNGKLQITRKASDNSPEAEITAQFRPTSLAHFAVNTDPKAARKAGGVNVQVAPGGAKFIPGAFLIRLRGSTVDGSPGNLGMAIRLKPGDVLKNKKKLVRLEGNLYLLFGPSVQQAFLNSKGEGVADDITPETLDFLEQEFLRLLQLDL